MEELHKPSVSILVATYNGADYIDEQLKSIQNQSGVEVLITVSDDCSSDETLQLISKVQSHTAKLRILPQIKQGKASSNFFRLLRDADLVHTDYVALSDQDDIWNVNKLAHSINNINKQGVDAYSANVTAFWPEGRQKLIHKAQPQQQWDYMFESAGPGCTFVLTKRLALEIQDFLKKNNKLCDEVALHDWFIYAFARSRGYKWFIDSASHVLYRQHESNVVGANVSFKAKLIRWKMLRDGWLVNQALLIAKILNYEDAWLTRKLQRYYFVDRLVLIVNIKKLRRRWRDRFAFAIFLLLSLKNKKRNAAK